jgi:hypothetical protein
VAILFDASGDRLSRTTTVMNHNAAYTMCGWINLVSAGSIRNPMGLTASTSIDAIGLTTTPRFARTVGGTASAFGPNPAATATWYFIAIRRNSTTSFQAFVDTTASAVSATDVSARAATDLMFLANRTDQTVNWIMAGIKAWDAALTDAELAEEMLTIRPKRFDNLWAYWPLWDAADVFDYSGNGRNWTINGSLTTADGPPVGWGARYWMMPRVASAPAPKSFIYKRPAARMTQIRRTW